MKKQVVFIMTDTTRKDMLGCYGDKRMITPNLDKLAAEGIRFDRAYTCQPVCGPARSALFTGTFPHSNGAVTNCIAMYDNVKTIGQRLTDNGIHCGYIGKWHLDGTDYFGNGAFATTLRIVPGSGDGTACDFGAAGAESLLKVFSGTIVVSSSFSRSMATA